MTRKLLAEFIGTFVLVFGGCGAAVLAAGAPDVGIGWLGVSFAFGLTVLCMAYAVGPISGGHFNPAVTLGLAAAGRFEAREVAPYVVVQTLGAIAAAAVLFVVVAGQPEFAGVGSFATNGYGAASPGGYDLRSAAVTEILLTAIFLIVILGATAPNGQPVAAPIAIGLALVLIHLISIPVTNTSVNPARSTGVALFAEGPALQQLWLFWVAPIARDQTAGAVWNWTDGDL